MEFEIIIKKLKNELSPEEETAFNLWYESSATHRSYYKKVVDNYQKTASPVATKEAWKVINSKITRSKKNAAWKIAVAASIIGVIAFFGIFQPSNKSQISDQSQIISSVIETGNDKAILTLADGTDLMLTNNPFRNDFFNSDGKEIVYESKAVETPPVNIGYNYLTVPVGGEYFVKLSDGTQIWLNSDSKLKYPVHFSGPSRTVELVYGEAYFKVTSSSLNSGANFIVETQNQLVEVLGTEFNIKAYREENFISTTLVEGKVSVINKETSEGKTLLPDQRLILHTNSNRFEKEIVDTDDIICWKDGFFRFKNKSLEDIMTTLSRWYDIEVVFENEELKRKEFNGVFRKDQQIQSILESIQNTREAKFKIEGRRIIIEKTILGISQ